MMETVIINGVEYQQIEIPEKKSKGSRAILAGLSMAIPYMMQSYDSSPRSRSLPPVNLVKEFELIQQKKSKLSKWERDQVVKIFNQRYTVVTPPPDAGYGTGEFTNLTNEKK